MGDGMDCLPGMRAVEASMAGKSTLTADAAEQAALRNLSKSEQRGEADRARAILLTLEGRRGDCRGPRGTCQHGAELAGLLCVWPGGGAAAAAEAGRAGHDRAARWS